MCAMIRMRGDALVALPENGVHAVVALERAATAARLAFVARGKIRIVEIGAARALQKISAGRRAIAQLRTRPREQRFAQHRVSPAHCAPDEPPM